MPGYPTFTVRNLGPIAEGAVELRPLTILIGKNNTGKTYMAQAIYAVFKALERANGPPKPLVTVEEAAELVTRLDPSHPGDDDLLNRSLRDKSESWMRARLDRAGEELASRLAVYFDVDGVQDLKRWGSPEGLEISAEVVQEPSRSTVLFSLENAERSNAPMPRVDVDSLRSARLAHYFDELLLETTSDADPEGEFAARRASSQLAALLWSHHFLPSVGLSGLAHYLPAGRSGLLEAWTDVVRLRLELDREGLALMGREPAALGGIGFDFLLELQELIRPQKRRKPRYSFTAGGGIGRSTTGTRDMEAAIEHLQQLIKGRVDIVHGRGRVPALTYEQGTKSIPVQRASSMVAELAPLISWIKVLLEPGDLLLIDEPEAHMHPEAILAVAKTLVALSRSGVRVSVYDAQLGVLAPSFELHAENQCTARWHKLRTAFNR